MKEFVTNAGDRLAVHSLEDCRGPVCPIHRPTPHHMRNWPMIWRGDRRIFERVCEHGIGHPDPDYQEAKLFIQGFMDGVHGCDFCCAHPRVGDWVNARSYYSNQLYVGVLTREALETFPPQFRYHVLDKHGNKFQVSLESAVKITKPEYTMVDFDPELR
jgi:hypothetical protein